MKKSKPKRWKTFKNAFKIPHRHPKAPPSSALSLGSKITKKKSIMDRFRLRRSNAPPPLQIRQEDPPHHSRPLSLVDDETIPPDTLAVLVDVVPSRSLPATPLSKRRHVELSPPESPLSTAPEPDNVVAVPIPVPTPMPSSETSKGNTEKRQSSPPSETAANATQKFRDQSLWDKIRDILESDDTACEITTSSYAQVPEQDQPWLRHSNALEQLRAFLSVCD